MLVFCKNIVFVKFYIFINMFMLSCIIVRKKYNILIFLYFDLMDIYLKKYLKF